MIFHNTLEPPSYIKQGHHIFS